MFDVGIGGYIYMYISDARYSNITHLEIYALSQIFGTLGQRVSQASRHAPNMSYTCPKHVPHMPATYSRHVSDMTQNMKYMSETHVSQECLHKLPKHAPNMAQNMCPTCPKHVQHMPKSYPTNVHNVKPKRPTHVPDSCPKHTQHMSRICPNHTRYMSN